MRRARTGCDRGAVLLEVIVSIVLVGVGLVSLVQSQIASANAAARARAIDAETRAALNLMDAARTWPTPELVRHMGTRRLGDFDLSVSEDRGLFSIRVSRAAGGQPIFATAVYRASVTPR